MKRLLVVGLMMTCSVSWAEWELHSSDSYYDGTILYYHDKSTIRRNGAIAKMWIMGDYSIEQIEAGGKRYKSTRSLYAFNCREETLTIISLVFSSGSMGNGNVVQSHTYNERGWEWEPIIPGTSGESAWKIACRKR